MIKKFAPLFLVIITILAFSTVVAAQTATESSQPEKTPEEIQQSLKERVQKAADKVKGVTSNGQKRGFIGTVKRISEESLTLDTTRGTLIIPVDDVVIVQNDKKMELKDIEIGYAVIVLGYQNGEDFQARRIVVSKTPLQPEPQTITVGNIKQIDKLSVGITPRGSSEIVVFSFDAKKTIFQDNQGETIVAADLEPSDDVIIISRAENPTTKSLNNSTGRAVLVRSLAEIAN